MINNTASLKLHVKMLWWTLLCADRCSDLQPPDLWCSSGFSSTRASAHSSGASSAKSRGARRWRGFWVREHLGWFNHAGVAWAHTWTDISCKTVPQRFRSCSLPQQPSSNYHETNRQHASVDRLPSEGDPEGEHSRPRGGWEPPCSSPQTSPWDHGKCHFSHILF